MTVGALDAVLADLAVESEQLGTWVDSRPDAWRRDTPAAGWTVADQIGHLHWTDEAARLAATDPTAFVAAMRSAAADPAGFVDAAAHEQAARPRDELLTAWRDGRDALAAALRAVPAGERVAWFGPPMSPTSMATARLMETWAHAHDVAEALGIDVPRTDRVRHVCHLGVRTRGFAFLVRDLPTPEVEPRIELTSPTGEVWTWGPEDATESVTGDAWDFALLVTRRRHRLDVDVRATGAGAERWLVIAQAFAGLPGPDPVRLAERTRP